MESKSFVTDKVMVNAIKMMTHAFRFKYLTPLVVDFAESLLFGSCLRILSFDVRDVYNYEADEAGFIRAMYDV